MSVLIYMNPVTPATNTFFDAITVTLDNQEIETCWEIGALESRLQRKRGDIRVLIALLPDLDSLKEFVLLRELLTGMRLVLATPECNSEVLRLCHTVFPRYITCIDSGPGDLFLILQKMQSVGLATSIRNQAS